jgi:hypothetical protein
MRWYRLYSGWDLRFSPQGGENDIVMRVQPANSRMPLSSYPLPYHFSIVILPLVGRIYAAAPSLQRLGFEILPNILTHGGRMTW